MKQRMWKAEIAKIIIVITIFAKPSIMNVWQGSEHVSGSENAKILDIPEFWICLWGSQYTRALNISGLHRALNVHKYFFDMPDHVWICLNMAKYAWIFLNMLEYAEIYVNVPELLLLYIHVSILFRVYLNAVTFFIKVYSLRKIRLFSCCWKYLICFLF